MKQTTKILTILILTSNICFGQMKVDPWEIYRGKYCYYEDTDQFIGDTVKIWSEGGQYSGFSQSKSFNWAPDSLKLKCDGSYKPIDGELGVIHFASPILNDRTGIDNIIYIIQIREHFVVIGCGFIIEKDSLSYGEHVRIVELRDSIKNAIYSQGCPFKTSYFQKSYFEAGKHEIDKLSETFACDLIAKGIDTILLIKSFYNNHGLGNSKYTAVLWLDNSMGKLKIFERKDNKIIHSKVEEINLSEILNYFFKTDIPEIKTNPAPNTWISTDLTFFIQLKLKDNYYIESLSNSEMTGDKVHEKSIWWTMITELVNEHRKNK